MKTKSANRTSAFTILQDDQQADRVPNASLGPTLCRGSRTVLRSDGFNIKTTVLESLRHVRCWYDVDTFEYDLDRMIPYDFDTIHFPTLSELSEPFWRSEQNHIKTISETHQKQNPNANHANPELGFLKGIPMSSFSRAMVKNGEKCVRTSTSQVSQQLPYHIQCLGWGGSLLGMAM